MRPSTTIGQTAAASPWVVGVGLVVVGAVCWAQDMAAAQPGIEIECVTSGYDVVLNNSTSQTLEPGQVIAWTVRFVRRSGEFVLEGPVAPGENIFVSGGLGSDYLSSPQPCTAILQ